ncbi:DUF4278 domain-containing protein [Nostoc edaphicum CCNP1411]|uniref:DUF4278 domain-containing protein n=1 Tax=Nostoc edaphicum CCNP1411 TaxID=1472755 RepID=A0A7D7LDJ3_9NOSO|nr:DUF4278 domain-containing protein [Nostoc edaphicum]QMS87852.1 DUF4278 domain-containing protein [Nostoc edaphicum CCNP1411]
MALYLLILPCAFFITGYFLLKRNNNEISHLVAVFAAISLILGLMLAPWQILLLLLILILISTSYEYYTSKIVSRETQYPQQPVPKSEPDYNLIYRGACYRADPNAKSDGVTIAPVTHKLSFRGCTYFVCADPNAKSDGVTITPVTHKLSFRGSTYSINRTAHREIKE